MIKGDCLGDARVIYSAFVRVEGFTREFTGPEIMDLGATSGDVIDDMYDYTLSGLKMDLVNVPSNYAIEYEARVWSWGNLGGQVKTGGGGWIGSTVNDNWYLINFQIRILKDGVPIGESFAVDCSTDSCGAWDIPW